ncbi:MAG: serine/threonine-protein phosphatase [Sphingomonas sp.]|nr:serine/threonine-protein phosphatase [Sphingomonas sp.]
MKRKVNEDSILVRTERGLWAVADGMGGHEAGDVASSSVVEALSMVPPHANLERFANDAMTALKNVNHQLIQLAREGTHPRTIGSTVVSLVISGEQFACMWAGDSRAYRVREGEIAQITRDHSLVQDLIDAGMLAPAEAEGHPNANVVTRAVGATEDLNVDVSAGETREGDLFILASDGLTRVVNDDLIYAELTSKPLEQAADRLVEMVLERGAPDNVSFVIVRMT